MIACPQCKNRRFEVTATETLVKVIEGRTDGDYETIREEVTDSVWHALACLTCGWKGLDDEARATFEATEWVTCKLCGGETETTRAHLHQGEYVGLCCWDTRLRNSE